MLESPASLTSIVVATRFRPSELRDCLHAIRRLADQPREIIVVDNSDGDSETAEVAASHGARYLQVSGTGLSGARNAGARAAAGEFIAFIDDDALAQDRWLTALCAPFDDPRVFAVTGRVVPREVSSPAHEMAASMGWLDLGLEAKVFDLETENWFEMANFGGIGLGGNMAFRRSAFDDWVGFRESFGLGSSLPGGEENFAFFELIREGRAVRYEPNAVVAHPYPETMAALRIRQRLLLGQAIAYMMLMFAEEPDYRGRIVRYAFGGLGVRRRRNRASARFRQRVVLPPWDVAAALGRAPVLFMRCRRASRVKARA